jgi:hypothetical protein
MSKHPFPLSLTLFESSLTDFVGCGAETISDSSREKGKQTFHLKTRSNLSKLDITVYLDKDMMSGTSA